jgi:hypothetical protein
LTAIRLFALKNNDLWLNVILSTLKMHYEES